MYYFEHYLAAGGVLQLESVAILETAQDVWVYDTLRDEISDVFPEAKIAVTLELSQRVDLVVLPIMGNYGFPFHDALYDELDELERLVSLKGLAQHIMIYRARWREVEVIAFSALRALLRRRRMERFFIRRCQSMMALRRLLKPLYPN